MTSTYEPLSNPNQSYGDVVAMLADMVDTEMTEEPGESGPNYQSFTEFMSFNGGITPLYPTEELQSVLGFSETARCKVIGEALEGMGIAVLIKPLNPFRKKAGVVGFYIQAEELEQDGPKLYDPRRAYDVFIGTGIWPKGNGAHFGPEFLDAKSVRPATEDEAAALMQTLQKHHDRKTRR
jgi:hypothetical protein